MRLCVCAYACRAKMLHVTPPGSQMQKLQIYNVIPEMVCHAVQWNTFHLSNYYWVRSARILLY